jgi:Domain of unknown function (DUF4272)
MDESERNYIDASPAEIEQQDIVNASWSIEAIVCLLWALNLLLEIPPFDEQADPELSNRLPNGTARELIRNARLRPQEEIAKKRDVAELWNWRARTGRLQESGQLPELMAGKFTIEEVLAITSNKASEAGDIPPAIQGDFPAFGKAYRESTPEEYRSMCSIAQERHHALNWLCGYAPGNRWSETPTDT